jgi:c-di-GMP-binding flagellar brake protein YcgR
MNALGIFMLEISLLLTLFPLQVRVTDFDLSGQNRVIDVVLFVVIIAAIITLLIFVSKFRKKPSLSYSGDYGNRDTRLTPSAGTGSFSFFTMRRIAKEIGLNRDQVKMLDYVFKTDGVRDIEKSIGNPELLDRHFKRAYRIIESMENFNESQKKLSVLFSTRNMLENSVSRGIGSTKQLKDDTSIVITFGKEKYKTSVIVSRSDSLAVEQPKNSLNSPVNIPNGSKLSIAAFTRNNKGYTFESRVLGSSSVQRIAALLLAHSNQVKPLSQRRFYRRQAAIPCNFFIVHVEGSGKHQRLVVDKKRNPGNIMDISVGGCSIKTVSQITGGTRLKVEFKQGDTVVAALGQVLRTNRAGVTTVMHIRFLKITLKSMNIINAFVYDYGY